MAYQPLQQLAETYPRQNRNALPQLVSAYRHRHEREILELAALATDVSIDDITGLGLEPESNPQLLKAFEEAYPNQSLDSLQDASREELQGWVNGVKGKHFEMLVAERLNAGETIGDLTLASGEVASLATDVNQPGWDLKIVDANGETVELVQLKATENFRYVKEALEKYPDIRVIVPEELDERAGLHDDVLAAGISNAELESETGEQLSELGEDTLTNLLHYGAEFAVDAVPVVSAVLIGVMEGQQVLMGRSSLEEAFKRGGTKLARSTVYSAIAAGLSVADFGIISLPTVTALRTAEGRVRHRMAITAHLEEKTQELRHELLTSRATYA